MNDSAAMYDNPQGEYPDVSGDMLTAIQFEVAIICNHQLVRAPSCPHCKKENLLDCLVRPVKPNETRTVRDVVEEFVTQGRISSFEVAESYIRNRKDIQSRNRQRRERRRRYKKWSTLAGLTAVGLLLVFEGGRLVLKLGTKAQKKKT